MKQDIPKEVETAYNQYQTYPSVENASALTNAVHTNTANLVLGRLERGYELLALAVKVLGSEDVFIDYLFSVPFALGKMPIEFLVDDKGVQIIMDELSAMEFGMFT